MSDNLTKFPNPHPDAPNKGCRVQADIDPAVFNYLFIKVLPGNGHRQPLICTFLQKLYEACLAEGIPPSWDYDTITRVNTILQRLNFDGPRAVPGVRPPRPGRTARSSSKSKTQPDGGSDEQSTVGGVGQET